MRKLYLSFPKSETLSNVLSWSHYFEILRSDNKLEISFYSKQDERENWKVRELKRQMKSMLFHRLALSKDKKGVLELSEQGRNKGKHFGSEFSTLLIRNSFVTRQPESTR
jgi:predicted nuclease of restriction endonuclease-like (RecB) superfamily